MAQMRRPFPLPAQRLVASARRYTTLLPPLFRQSVTLMIHAYKQFKTVWTIRYVDVQGFLASNFVVVNLGVPPSKKHATAKM